MTRNPLVDFLAAYGPTSDGNNMYDEFVVAAASKADLAPLEIDETRSDEIIADLQGDPARSVILTGTAGDGKTYTARKVLAKLTEGASGWKNTESIVSIRFRGRNLHFVKDMSELPDGEKSDLVLRLEKAFSDKSGSADLYVVCVNDGHLLSTWSRYSKECPHGERILEQFQLLLKNDEENPNGFAFRLVNMSRRSHADTLDNIIDAICKHPAWQSCPADCPALDPNNRCPILVNRDEFLKEGVGTLRERLKSLIQIAAADGEHLSIRQIMILVVNALLGDAKGDRAKPILNCRRAQQQAKRTDRSRTNPFDNIFGTNHPPARRSGYAAFSTLERFAIGYETNNYFDDHLLSPHGDDLPDHPYFGESIFSQARNNYIENSESGINELRDKLVAQRRRLFFTAHDAALNDDPEQSPWRLTVHHHGDLFLNLLVPDDRQDSQLTRVARRRIIKGLNRTLTGSLTETSDRLWLTQPSGVYHGAEMHLLVGRPVGWRGAPWHLDLAPPSQPGRPPGLNLHSRQRVEVTLEMIPTLFEYLMRVADGALPTSFSKQCFQDIRNFQIQCVAVMAKHMRQDEYDLNFEVVETDGEKLALHPVGLLEDAD